MMKRALTLLPLAALSLALGGCGTQNRGLESVHQPVVQRTDYVYDVAAGGPLSAEDRGRLTGWLDAMHLSYGDHVSLDDPSGSTALHADVAQIMGARGLLMEETAPVTGAPLAPGEARVVVSRMHAEVPGCPDWSAPSQPNFNGSTMSNYGCATNASLAAMVADPQDLLQGRGEGSVGDPETGAKAIRTYRAAPSRDGGALKIETNNGGH